MYFFNQNAGISFLTSDLFKYNPHIRLLDLSDNLFSKIPAGCFDHQHGISELTLYNIEWECTCDNLWWIQHIVSGNITAHSDMMCNNQQGTSTIRIEAYYIQFTWQHYKIIKISFGHKVIISSGSLNMHKIYFF